MNLIFITSTCFYDGGGLFPGFCNFQEKPWTGARAKVSLSPSLTRDGKREKGHGLTDYK